MKPHKYVLVVPAYEETYDTVDRLTASADPAALVILVVNRSAGNEPARISNQLLMNEICANAGAIDHPFGLEIYTRTSRAGRADVLCVDRSSDGREVRGGVGMARKIGFDIAFKLRRDGLLESPWIHTTDCDTILPADFFAAAEAKYTDESSLCVRAMEAFSDKDEQAHLLGRLNEISIRIALAAYERAGSPWAVRVTGCGIGISHWAYEAIGGMQPYEYNEDGAIIGAAGKIGIIHRVFGERLRFEARPVSRGPTGYGKNVAQAIEKLDAGMPINATSPKVWQYVAAFHHAIRLVIDGSNLRRSCKVASREASSPAADLDPGLTEDLILQSIGPLDVMLGGRASDDRQATFTAVHRLLDHRKMHRVKDELIVRCGTVPYREAFAAAGLHGTISEMLARASDLEERTCDEDTGPIAMARRTYPRSV